MGGPLRSAPTAEHPKKPLRPSLLARIANHPSSPINAITIRACRPPSFSSSVQRACSELKRNVYGVEAGWPSALRRALESGDRSEYPGMKTLVEPFCLTIYAHAGLRAIHPSHLGFQPAERTPIIHAVRGSSGEYRF